MRMGWVRLSIIGWSFDRSLDRSLDRSMDLPIGRSVVCLSMMIGLSRRRNSYFQPRAVPRSRFYREFARQQSHPFSDDGRPLASRFQFRIGKPARKGKPFSVILHRQLQITSALRQTYQHMVRSTVLADVDQTLLHNARQFAARFLRQVHLLEFCDELGGDSRFSPEALHRVGDKTQK